MSETIMIPFIDPGLEVIDSYPHKIVFESDYLEIFSKAKVRFDDDQTNLKRDGSLDDIRIVLKQYVSGVEIYRGKQYQNMVLSIACNGFQQDSQFYFAEFREAKEVYVKIKNWILNANT